METEVLTNDIAKLQPNLYDKTNAWSAFEVLNGFKTNILKI